MTDDDPKFVDTVNQFDPRLPSPTEVMNAQHRHEVNTPEPAPTPNDRPAIWDLVVADVEGTMSVNYPESSEIAVKTHAVADMRARDAFGRAKYGTPLQPENGRDALVDAYQEALDLSVYLKQSVVEKYDGMVHAFYVDALNIVLELRQFLDTRNTK